MSHEYEGVRRVVFGEGATFVPVCPKCGRFVRVHETATFKGESEQPFGDNATCKRCGPVAMPFEGYV